MIELQGSTDALTCQRELFDVPPDVTYLNAANIGPRLRSVSDAGARAVLATAMPWRYSAADWFTDAETLRDLFGAIINGDADGVAIIPSASYGIAIAAANAPLSAGDSILLLDREFPSNVYAWQDLARRRSATVRFLTKEPGCTWAESVLNAIDSRTAIVALPNCHWTDGAHVDLLQVRDAARGVGALFVVDGSQSVGALPIDVARLQPDFLVSVGYKWLLGPYGLGYLYVAPRWRDIGLPIEHSWLARAGSDNFARLTEYTSDYRDGARRFDMGEFPQMLLAPMAIAALRQILAWGVPRIQRTLAQLSDAMRTAALPPQLESLTTEGCAHHITGLRLHGISIADVTAALASANIFASIRGDVLRVAPHLHNDGADFDRLMSVLRACASRRAPGPA